MRRLAVAGTAAAALLLGWKAWTSSLPPAAGARWIRCLPSEHLGVMHTGEAFSYFAHDVRVDRQPASAPLRLRAHRDVSVRVDGEIVLPPRGSPERWREERVVDLAPSLKPGMRRLFVTVMARDGTPALWAAAPAIGVATGPGWVARCDGLDWAPAVPASAHRPPSAAADAPTCLEGFLAWLPLIAALCGGAWLLRFPATTAPERVERALIAFWAALGVLSWMRLPLGVGFDQQAHYEYILRMARGEGVPLATDGWQMFQPPLYYALGAVLLHKANLWLDGPAMIHALRLLNIGAGMAIVALSARLLKQWLPSRPDLRAAGLLVAGLLPMNLSSFQTLSNEPLCAALTAATLAAAARWLDGRETPARAGLLWGAAALAKVTPILLAPALFWVGLKRRRPREALVVAAAAAAVCGWYYGWVWSRLGRPFVGGWDASRGISWWQEPGLRALDHVLSFGAALRQPIYAGLDGLWDGLYSTLWGDGFLSGITSAARRPPWRYGLMSAGMWLALTPTGLMAAGLWRAARGRLGAPGRFASACTGAYAAAVVWLYLGLPAYSAAKATYFSGLTPLFGFFAAAGLDAVPEGRARRLAGAALAAWAGCAALAYLPG